MDLQTKLKLTKEHWENAQVESLKDSNLRTLEIDSIVSSLQKYMVHSLYPTLADFGCGDGLDTQEFSRYAVKSVGFDYSNEMLSRASQRRNENLDFIHLDLISDSVRGTYDTVVTKRCIINLGEWSIQSRCIEKLAKAVLPGGLFIMLECFKQGFDNLNFHRNKMGLPPLDEPYHNSYLNFDETMMCLSKNFTVIETRDFSTYYYLTRCLSPRITGEKAFAMDEDMRLAAEADDIFQGLRIGPQTLVCLRKKRE